MLARAPAKINLTLEVVRRRPDGYHDIISVFHAIGVFDELEFHRAERLQMSCDVQLLCSDDNLALRAARALAAAAGKPALGASIRLMKRIPIAAGLGGGSSDAAATIAALNELWALNLSRSELARIGTSIGSDVAFFLGSPAALVTGRGDTVEPLPAAHNLIALVVTPRLVAPLIEKTRRAYASLLADDFLLGSASLDVAASLKSGKAPRAESLKNSFTRVSRGLFPGTSALIDKLGRLGAPPASVAGSGPTVFCLYDSHQLEGARRMAETLDPAECECFVAPLLEGESAIGLTLS